MSAVGGGAGDAGRGQAVRGRFDAATLGIMPSTIVTSVHLLRHGAVEELTQRVVRGQRDAQLSAHGRAQHELLAQWYAHGEPRPDRVLSSDLSRCRELAERVAALTRAPLELDGDLREQSMGAWEGRSWEELTRSEARAVSAYWSDHYDARPPDGESVREHTARVVAWWTRTLAAHRGERLAVVTHVGVIRALVCHLLGVPASQGLRFAPATASHTALLVGDAGAVLTAFGERPWLGVEETS